jgi:hypothetical protein
MPNGLFVRVGPHLPAVEAIPEYTNTLSALQNTIALQAQKNHPEIQWYLPEKIVSVKEGDYVTFSYDYSEVDPVLLKTDAKNASIARANTALAQFTQYKKNKTKMRPIVKDQYINKPEPADAFGGTTLTESFNRMSKAWHPSAQLKPVKGVSIYGNKNKGG